MSAILFFLPPILATAFFIIGREYKDFAFGFIGGLVFFLYGVGLLITPLPTVSNLTNLVLSTAMWGIGAYIIIRGSIEAIQNRTS